MGFTTTGGDNNVLKNLRSQWKQEKARRLTEYTDDELIAELNKRRLTREMTGADHPRGRY